MRGSDGMYVRVRPDDGNTYIKSMNSEDDHKRQCYRGHTHYR